MEPSHRSSTARGKAKGEKGLGKVSCHSHRTWGAGWLIGKRERKEGNADKGKEEKNKDYNEALTFSSLPSSMLHALSLGNAPAEDKGMLCMPQAWTESFPFLPGLSIFLHVFTVNRVQGTDFLIVLRSQVQVLVSLQGRTAHVVFAGTS